MQKTIRFRAQVHDASCERAIEKAVRKMEGVARIKADHRTGECSVTFDAAKTGEEEIFSAIRETGHECPLAAPEAESKTKPQTVRFRAEGMHCTSCEKIIERQALKIDGVRRIKADYRTGEGAVMFDSSRTDKDEIFSAIGEKGYECSELREGAGKSANWLGMVSAALGLLLVAGFALFVSDRLPIPQIAKNMSYGLIFVLGLLTGLHCVAMCGGFVISYVAKDAESGRKPHKSHLLYATGKLASYTVLGAAFGLVGSIVAFTPLMRGIVGIIAGLFLILFGLKTLNILPFLRRLTFTPKFLSRFVGEKSAHNSSRPLVIGLLNGLMLACGPLQAMYVLAAGTGNSIEGAKLLFIFGLGTLPFMMAFAYLASSFTSRLTHRILNASGAVVVVLGVLLLNNGLALTGSGYDFRSLTTSAPKTGVAAFSPTAAQNAPAQKFSGQVATLKDGGYQEIRMDVTYAGYAPNSFMLKKGVPVRWIVNGKEISSCNGEIVVPKYNLDFKVISGEQTINFTPDASGLVPWSCWMGMIHGSFVVVDDLSAPGNATLLAAAATPSGGSGGGCGCGGKK